MGDVLITGFPGFLGSALLPRILSRRADTRALCLVQSRYLALAKERVEEIQAAHPHARDRIALLEGDITSPWLGIDIIERTRVERVTEVWHLAAIYDLTVPEGIARRVNVEGTGHVLEFCLSRREFDRLHYVSTCYVSGDFVGEFGEDDLDLGQGFLNHYEATKFEAEVLVRRAMKAGLRATIYRPGMVIGDSRTGETQKYDGPYMVAAFMRKQPLFAIIPELGPLDEVRAGMVPRDYVVAAMDALAGMESSVGRSYALTDPSPPTAREFVHIVANHLGKRPVFLPLPKALTRTVVERAPGLERILGLPAEVLDYFATRTTYSTVNAVGDLAGTGVTCPRFSEYAGTILDFMIAHPEFDSSAMT